MSEMKTVCLRNGCLWLSGGVCSRECAHKRAVNIKARLRVERPPRVRETSSRWQIWARSSWRELRRFYGRGKP